MLDEGSSVDKDMKVPWEVSNLQEKLLCHPVPLDVVVEVKKLVPSGSEQEEDGFSQEQFMHIRGQISHGLCDDLSRVIEFQKDEKINIILVVDRSGSMSGNPFNQVKTAMNDTISQCVIGDCKVLDVILYNSKAESLSFTLDNYTDVINKLSATGSTNFKAAFDQIELVMKKRSDISHTVILFMTDGRDTVSSQVDLNAYVVQWTQSLKDYQQQVTVHAVGFSTDHDMEFLTRISQAGNQTGMYRYCEPGDGPIALTNKLKELFSYVSYSGGFPVQLEVVMGHGDNKLLLTGSQSERIDGTLNFVENEDGSKDMIVSGECWIYLSDAGSLPQITFGIILSFKKNRVNYTLQILCEVRSMSRKIIADANGSFLWDLAVLSREADSMSAELSDTISAGGDVKTLIHRLDQLHDSVSKIQVYKAGHDKSTRANIMEFIKEIKSKMDIIHSVMSHCLRGEAKTMSLLARAEDLKYDAHFSKARRQRLMDRRVAKNFHSVKYHAQKAAVATEESLRSLSDDALKFYYCILSMCSVKDILMDESELDNALGIGLAVARPEHVIDNPTSLRVYSISGALVSRSSVMDALNYKISTENALSAHGGFSFVRKSGSDLPHATVGASREPINAWLPLYICPAHWDRVKTLLRPSLGYICTLDPLGYSAGQVDVFFMILGCMIGQLWENEVGENQLKIIFALQKTCQACIKEFRMEDRITSVLHDFLESPFGRFPSLVPNLFTLIGFMVSLPALITRRLLNLSVENESEASSCSKFWLSIITESLRRASNAKPELNNDENTTLSLLNMLLHGLHNQAGHTSKFKNYIGNQTTECFGHVSWMLACHKKGDTEFAIPKYEPTKEVNITQIEMEHSAEVDLAMEICAQAECGVIKDHTEAIANAKKVAQKWITKIKESAGLYVPEEEPTDTVDSDETNVASSSYGGSHSTSVDYITTPTKEEAKKKAARYDTQAVDASIFEATVKVLTYLSPHIYPPLSTLPACMGFLQHLLTSKLEDKEMDSEGALPSQLWIDSAKQTVDKVFKKITEFQTKCKAAVAFERKNDSCELGDHRDNDLESDRKDKAADDHEETGSGDEDAGNQHLKSACRTRKKRIVTIPMLLNIMGIENGSLPLLVIRAMLCQAVNYPNNFQAKSATYSGELTNLAINTGESAHKFLLSIEAKLIEIRDTVSKKVAEEVLLKNGNFSMLRAESIWAFIGYLKKTHQDHQQGFNSLVNSTLSGSDVHIYPQLTEKIRVLLMSRYQNVVVFARGNVWTPKNTVIRKLKVLFGEEVWKDIEKEQQRHVHIYRESDIPNRHGHCRSNPYIPKPST